MSLRFKLLPKSLFLSSAAEVAPRLLGARIISRIRRQEVSGKIVEVEAYVQDDEACHANRGKTKRNSAMFGPPGHAYIYQIHKSFCLNMVTCPQGVGEAVLIRAIEPLTGEDIMRKRRFGKKIKVKSRLLTSGPGRVCQALGLNLHHNGVSLSGPVLWVCYGPAPRNIEISERIGISKNKEALLRFFDPKSLYLSR